MIANPALPAYRYDPYSRRLTHETYEHDSLYSLWRTAILTARKAKSWGIILGSLGRQGNPHTMRLIEDKLKHMGIPWVNLLLSEIFPGKLATHEFAIGGPCFDLPFPPARNPWNPANHPGGSSSGSGAAVAARMLPAALGTHTGGSVRHPATHCGLVGLKPTYGLVSRRGVFPLAFTLDHVGPMTRTVRDNALLLGVMLGRVAPVALMVGMVGALVPAAYLFAKHGQAARKMGIPFGPFLALGGLVGLFAGDAILDAYLGLL